jgi:hypothetical protein
MKSAGFSQENGEQHGKDPFEAAFRIYRRFQRRAARREIGPPIFGRL